MSNAPGFEVQLAAGGAAPGQPFNARFTAAMISSTVTAPSPLVSRDGQASGDVVPSAMFTPLINSSTVTLPR